MSAASARKFAAPDACDTSQPACLRRIAALETALLGLQDALRGLQQSNREMSEAVRCNTEASERRNKALANIERRLVLGDNGLEVRKTGGDLPAVGEP